MPYNEVNYEKKIYTAKVNNSTDITKTFKYVAPLGIHVSKGKGLDPINRITPAIFFSLSQTKTWISNVICRGLFCVRWVQLGWQVIVRFVDIGRINDHHFINFLSILSAASQHISLNRSKMIMTYVDGNPGPRRGLTG